MKLFDTHTHLYLPEFDADRDEMIARAFDNGVNIMMLPNVSIETIKPMKELHRRYREHTMMAMGLHPTEVGESWEEDLGKIHQELTSGAYRAIGEIGMDLYWEKEFRSQQMKVFDEQLCWAEEMSLPVIIHCREALDETLEVLSGHSGRIRGIFHSFGGTREDVDRIRACGDFYFGINGIVTFKNSKLSNVLPHIGIDRLVLETDAPYLAPVPNRGKRNESAFITATALKVADALSLDAERVGEQTYENAMKIFAV
ncbi:MAG: TatD family hydrolase [Duncaniella sp.]|nr:TatD family hydrolase [Duncaniella sp.]